MRFNPLSVDVPYGWSLTVSYLFVPTINQQTPRKENPGRGTVLLIWHDERGLADHTLHFDVLTRTVCWIGQCGNHDLHITHSEASQAHIRKTPF